MKIRKHYIVPVSEVLDMTARNEVMWQLGTPSGIGELAPERRSAVSVTTWK